MTGRLHDLAERIHAELHELDQVVGRVQEAWQRAQRSADDFYMDSAALNLHGFYTGLERIFTLVAETVDGILPTGENWHQALIYLPFRSCKSRKAGARCRNGLRPGKV